MREETGLGIRVVTYRINRQALDDPSVQSINTTNRKHILSEMVMSVGILFTMIRAFSSKVD